MNILVLTTSYPSHPDDASGAFIHSLVRALARRGHQLRVVVPWRSGPDGRREVDGIPTWHFRYAPTDRGHKLTATAGGIPEALRRSRWAACRIPLLMARFVAAGMAHARWADVIYANWLGAGLVGAMIGLGHRVPMAITLRGDDAYLIRDRLPWRLVARWVFGRSAAVSVVSANMVKSIEPAIPPSILPVIVPTFGVDTERLRPADDRPTGAPSATGLRGLFVGNVSRAKGVDVLLRALASTCDAWHDFTIVGDGPDMEMMQQLAAESGLTGRVAWTGRKGVTEIPSIMQRADFLVLPSLSEGRPNVVIEAMATGLPVIATDVGGTADMIHDGRTGLLVPPGDEASLAAAIKRLGDDPEWARRCGRDARQFVVRKNLTWDRTAGEFEVIFRKARAAGP